MMDEVRGYHRSVVLKSKWGKQGVTIEHTHTVSDARGCKKMKVETLKILTTSQMDGAVVQCAARYRGKPTYIYSKFAILRTIPDTTEGSTP